MVRWQHQRRQLTADSPLFREKPLCDQGCFANAPRPKKNGARCRKKRVVEKIASVPPGLLAE
jgi:hypothetical protein